MLFRLSFFSLAVSFPSMSVRTHSVLFFQKHIGGSMFFRRSQQELCEVLKSSEDCFNADTDGSHCSIAKFVLYFRFLSAFISIMSQRTRLFEQEFRYLFTSFKSSFLELFRYLEKVCWVFLFLSHVTANMSSSQTGDCKFKVRLIFCRNIFVPCFVSIYQLHAFAKSLFFYGCG